MRFLTSLEELSLKAAAALQRFVAAAEPGRTTIPAEIIWRGNQCAN